MIGEAYRAQKMTQGAPKGNTNAAKQSLQNEDFESNGKTKNIIAEKFNVGGSTVERAGNFVESLDAANTISAGFKDAVRSGVIKAPQYVIQEIRNIPEAKLPAAVEAIKSGDIGTAKEIIQQSKPEPPRRLRAVPQRGIKSVRGTLRGICPKTGIRKTS